MKILITSGGCKVPIDDVRHIGNFSSGRYGAALADEFMKAGHDVIFFHEKGSIEPNYVFHKFGEDLSVIGVNPTRKEYKNYFEYLKVKDIIKKEKPDIIISAAAISDYIVDKVDGKISSDNEEMVIRLKKGEKVIKSFRELAPKATIIGFKLLVSPTKEDKYAAISKQMEFVDRVVFNDLTELREGKQDRELVYWAEEGRLGSSKFTVKELVEEILITHTLTSVLK